MSQLRHLKVLILRKLLEVEYVESINIIGECCTTSTSSRQVFFPSLEKLQLSNLPKLKGWWKSSSHSDSESGEDETEVENANDIVNNNNKLQREKQPPNAKMHNCEELDNDLPWRCLAPYLHDLELYHLPQLVKLPKGMHHLTALHFLHIYRCENMEAIPPWIECLSSLQSLKIGGCKSLKSLPEEMRQLTSLQRLYMKGNSEELYKRCQKFIGVDWSKIKHIPRSYIGFEGDRAVKKRGKAI